MFNNECVFITMFNSSGAGSVSIAFSVNRSPLKQPIDISFEHLVSEHSLFSGGYDHVLSLFHNEVNKFGASLQSDKNGYGCFQIELNFPKESVEVRLIECFSISSSIDGWMDGWENLFSLRSSRGASTIYKNGKVERTKQPRILSLEFRKLLRGIPADGFDTADAFLNYIRQPSKVSGRPSQLK